MYVFQVGSVGICHDILVNFWGVTAIKSTISQVGQSIYQQEEKVMRCFKVITKWKMLWFFYQILLTTILDKTVEKIVYLDSIFLNIVVVPVRPSPPSPESNVVVYSKESLIPGRLWEATLDWGKGFSCRKGVVLEIALLHRRVDMMGKTFSSSFVQDCSSSRKCIEISQENFC